MSKIKIENCPETGICSLIKENGEKVDLMPDEASDLREALNDTEKMKSIIGEVDPSFSDNLDLDELSQIKAGV